MKMNLPPDDWNLQASEFIKRKRYRDAIACCNKAIKINPKDVIALHAKGKALYRLSKEEEDDYSKVAISCYNEAIKINPQYSDAMYDKGCIYFDLRNYEFAIGMFTQVKQLVPDGAIASIVKCYNSIISKNLVGAIACCDDAIRIDPTEIIAWHFKGMIHHSLGEFRDALECYTKITELDALDKNAWAMKGMFLNKIKESENQVGVRVTKKNTTGYKMDNPSKICKKCNKLYSDVELEIWIKTGDRICVDCDKQEYESYQNYQKNAEQILWVWRNYYGLSIHKTPNQNKIENTKR